MLSCQRHLKYQELVRETPDMLSDKEILSALIVKRLVLEQDKFLKIEQRVRSCKFQQNCKLQVFVLKLRVKPWAAT